MKSDLEFCINFINEIEKYPQIYDKTSEDYSNRKVTESIWSKIGEKFNESAQDCRNKWKVIRSSYCRSINNKNKSDSGSSSTKKEYYLAKNLKFLNLFAKTRPRKGKEERQSTDWKNSNYVEFAEDSNDKHENENEQAEIFRQRKVPELAQLNPLSPLIPNTHTHQSIASEQYPAIANYSQRSNDVADKCTVDYFTVKKRKFDTATTFERDPCELFLLSLVPHMKTMTPRQQLAFQRAVLEQIEIIKYQTPASENQDSREIKQYNRRKRSRIC